jgi:hypothetical protein
MTHDDILKNLSDSLPSFIASSQENRLRVFVIAQEHINNLIDDHLLNDDQAFFLISMLFNKNTDFKKSALMMAVCLDQVDTDHLHPIAIRFANEIRRDLGLELVPV